MFSSIILDKENFSEYRIADGEDQNLENLGKINIFIGSNNSGKSRFLRRIFGHEKLKFRTKFLDLAAVNRSIRQLKEAAISLQYDPRKMVESIQEYPYLDSETDLNIVFRTLDNALEATERYPEHIRVTDSIIIRKHLSALRSLLNDNHISSFRAVGKIYIPILRGLRPTQAAIKTDGSITSFIHHHDNYLHRAVKDYFSKANAIESRIFTGLNLYEETQNLLLGDSHQRNKIRLFESFLSSTFFHDKEVNIVPRKKDDVLHIKIGKDEYPIYELGDGIQSIIILTYPLFFNQDENLIAFFEEPEMHLHPGLQRVFLETLRRDEFKKFQFFITTHSNHLLDLTLDCEGISVYTFLKKENTDSNTFEIRNVNSTENNVLELLGVRNSSVFLSNCTIWVEGITDRLYLRKFLEIVQQSKPEQYKEDLHYSFVEYGGNNITHWSFLDSEDGEHPNINVDRLCSRLFLITDNDNAGLGPDGTPNSIQSKKSQRHRQLKEKLGERYYCLNAREIENLLSKEVLKKTIHSYSKNKENLDFSLFDGNDHKTTYLGHFIDKNVTGLKRKFAANSDESSTGTIRNKPQFCKKAIENILSLEDLSEESILLAEKLYEFIKISNS